MYNRAYKITESPTETLMSTTKMVAYLDYTMFQIN